MFKGRLLFLFIFRCDRLHSKTDDGWDQKVVKVRVGNGGHERAFACFQKCIRMGALKDV